MATKGKAKKARTSREEILETLCRWQEGGQTKREFAKENGINIGTFYQWTQKYGRNEADRNGQAVSESLDTATLIEIREQATVLVRLFATSGEHRQQRLMTLARVALDQAEAGV